MRNSDLKLMVGKNENILWQGKPDKKCFILESIFNPMFPFALIWGLVDMTLLKGVRVAGAADNGLGLFMVGFFLLHMMPVWIYLIGVLFSFRKYRNTEYIITDRGIYVSGGTFTYTYEMKPFTDLSHINIHRGIFDQFLGVGDVVSVCNHTGNTSGGSHSHSSHGLTICDISDYQRVFSMLKDLQTDIYADTMYPNDLRPEMNHGYRTSYQNNQYQSGNDMQQNRRY